METQTTIKEKKQYIVPHTDVIHIEPLRAFMDWSADKGSGGGGNVPEARQVFVIGDGEESQRHNPWKD